MQVGSRSIAAVKVRNRAAICERSGKGMSEWRCAGSRLESSRTARLGEQQRWMIWANSQEEGERGRFQARLGANEGKTLRLFSVHLPFVIVVALTQWREYGGKGGPKTTCVSQEENSSHGRVHLRCRPLNHGRSEVNESALVL